MDMSSTRDGDPPPRGPHGRRSADVPYQVDDIALSTDGRPGSRAPRPRADRIDDRHRLSGLTDG